MIFHLPHRALPRRDKLATRLAPKERTHSHHIGYTSFQRTRTSQRRRAHARLRSSHQMDNRRLPCRRPPIRSQFHQAPSPRPPLPLPWPPIPLSTCQCANRPRNANQRVARPHSRPLSCEASVPEPAPQRATAQPHLPLSRVTSDQPPALSEHAARLSHSTPQRAFIQPSALR